MKTKENDELFFVSIEPTQNIADVVDTTRYSFSGIMPVQHIVNGTTTILKWNDGTKTIVRLCDDDIFNEKLGFLIAYFQYASGLSKNEANKFLKELDENVDI